MLHMLLVNWKQSKIEPSMTDSRRPFVIENEVILIVGNHVDGMILAGEKLVCDKSLHAAQRDTPCLKSRGTRMYTNFFSSGTWSRVC